MIRPLYKAVEPFMEVKKGFGFLGVVQYDDIEDKIQCHVCGKFFKHLGLHLAKHDYRARDYKEEFGLTLRTPLCSKGISSLRRTIMSKNMKGGKCPPFSHSGMSKEWYRKREKNIKREVSMSQLNSHGLCDLQMKSRYEVVKEIVGNMPTETEIRHYDLKLWAALTRRFGSINKARIWLKEKQMARGEWKVIPEIQIVAALRKFAKERKRLPTFTDFKMKRGDVSCATVWRTFGSWNQALRMAGLK